MGNHYLRGNGANHHPANASFLSKMSLLSSKTSIGGDSRLSSDKFSRFANVLREHNIKQHKEALNNTKK